ncbi:MAG: sulfate adenylyltransferase subunit CysN [Betaproteobacteria bacterium]
MEEIEQLLKVRGRLELLRFVTCGSVDDGKSTLIGRLLYDAGMLYEDQMAALAADSKKHGTQGDNLDFALLMDGLTAEREQGITIDVAYRFFATEQRKFIVGDTPGHEQYTRNMITGVSTADAAVILVDARKGILTQTRRHAFLVALMGVRYAAIVVNKMDLVDYSEECFRRIEADCRAFSALVGLQEIIVIPVCAIDGDNVISRSARMAWYQGASLIRFLHSVPLDQERAEKQPFRLPVQWINRPNQDFRGYCGTIASGGVRPGDLVRVYPSGRETRVARVVAMDGDLHEARAGQSITVTLTDNIDISRGDIIAHADAPPGVADQFEATVIWMGEQPMLGGRPYVIKIGTRTAVATPAAPKYRIDVNTLEHLSARRLCMNEIGVCNLSVDRPIAFDAYRDNREMGGFILIDRLTNETVGAGLLHFALRRADNIQMQALDVDRQARAMSMGQKPCIIWLTGLSGAGKSTIANLLEKRLFAAGKHTYLIDGDNIRHGLNRDLGFTDADRVENVRRVAEVARLMMDAGLVAIVALISPFRSERRLARSLVEAGEFFEVFVDAPLEVAEKRDPKGLYRKARRGELKNFTGIDAPYETPEQPEIRIDTDVESPESATDQIMNKLIETGFA